jgi:hypothetical protein
MNNSSKFSNVSFEVWSASIIAGPIMSRIKSIIRKEISMINRP